MNTVQTVSFHAYKHTYLLTNIQTLITDPMLVKVTSTHLINICKSVFVRTFP